VSAGFNSLVLNRFFEKVSDFAPGGSFGRVMNRDLATLFQSMKLPRRSTTSAKMG
jgi:hypothetical protein